MDAFVYFAAEMDFRISIGEWIGCAKTCNFDFLSRNFQSYAMFSLLLLFFFYFLFNETSDLDDLAFDRGES